MAMLCHVSLPDCMLSLGVVISNKLPQVFSIRLFSLEVGGFTFSSLIFLVPEDFQVPIWMYSGLKVL